MTLILNFTGTPRSYHYRILSHFILAHLIIINIQDGTDSVPPSWIVQEPQTATTPIHGCPCSSRMARVSLDAFSTQILKHTTSLGSLFEGKILPSQTFASFQPQDCPFSSGTLPDGDLALSTSASPSLSTRPCSGPNLPWNRRTVVRNLTLKQIQAATPWDFSSVSLQAASIRGFTVAAIASDDQLSPGPPESVSWYPAATLTKVCFNRANVWFIWTI